MARVNLLQFYPYKCKHITSSLVLPATHTFIHMYGMNRANQMTDYSVCSCFSLAFGLCLSTFYYIMYSGLHIFVFHALTLLVGRQK